MKTRDQIFDAVVEITKCAMSSNESATIRTTIDEFIKTVYETLTEINENNEN